MLAVLVLVRQLWFESVESRMKHSRSPICYGWKAFKLDAGIQARSGALSMS
jgi:hypothetical protein